MFRHFIALAAIAFLSACATSAPQTFSGQFEPPPANSRVVVMTPNVQLAVLTAAGIPEPREDWSVSARDNIAASVEAHIQREGHAASALDPTTAMEGRSGQIIRLHDAVGASLIQANFGMLPTHRDRFEWTLGEGVREFGATYEADYAVFVSASGSYSSAARAAAVVGAALLGIGLPTGGQVAYASLVDLRTGNVLWFNVVTASPSEDMREPAGAAAIVERLMSEAPL